ncbi:MAG: DegT/DnrJ/EryC1/StrS family aminotransferase [Candidatus Omnitrophica bacterium]|nr:DegT/DnrJ/EryC1/StrS family aminotransferase [Candidatus Omnitrophota bacterium]
MAVHREMTKVPYFNTTRQYLRFKTEIDQAIAQVLDSGNYILSDIVRAFEEEFAAYCTTPDAIGIGSGTDALILALKAVGIQPKDEILVPSYTFVSTVYAITHVGAKPVFADVDPKTFNLDPVSVERLLSKKTKAILPVHLYGLSADMDALMQIVRTKKLKLIEDCAQAHGAEWSARRVGSFGDAGCFSFYPTKNLGAFGDGGMVTTLSEKTRNKVREFRNVGRNEAGKYVVAGWATRLDAVQAAILRVKLKHLDELTERRQEIAGVYDEYLKETPLILPYRPEQARHVYHLYVVRVPSGKRDDFRQKLAEEGVQTMIHYEVPVHRHPAYRQFVRKSQRLPITDRLCREVVALPMFPEMEESEIDRVYQAAREFYRRK